MKNPLFIIIGIALFFVFGMQVFMFYQLHEKLGQQYELQKKLNISSYQGSDSWIEDTEHWNPYRELFHMRNQMEKLFNESASRFHKNSSADSLTKMPALNLKDEAGRYIVTADVPGSDESSLSVTLDGHILTLSIKTKNIYEKTDDNNKYQLKERFSGKFHRSITLPGDVEKDRIKTEYNNGVLTIILPKAFL